MAATFAVLERIQPLADVLRHFGAVKSVSEVGVDPEVPKQFEHRWFGKLVWVANYGQSKGDGGSFLLLLCA